MIAWRYQINTVVSTKGDVKVCQVRTLHDSLDRWRLFVVQDTSPGYVYVFQNAFTFASRFVGGNIVDSMFVKVLLETAVGKSARKQKNDI